MLTSSLRSLSFASTHLALVIFLLLFSRADADEGTGLQYARQMMLEAFEHEVAEISSNWMRDIETLQDWKEQRPLVRRQLAEMLGLHPEPEKTDLKVEITGSVDHAEFTVQKLHFQSLPGLYVTANLYVPKNLSAPAPAVLYLCGHAPRVIDGVSYGPKAAYQHHPAWYARNGMISLIIDTIDNGEIRGLHHGTYSHDRWWWYSLGYTPAAVEVWNAIRALDYLESLPEVDSRRLGVTGRSGGGIYSWLLLALDERVQVATPTAGITDLQNHLLDEVISGHCDCNYWNNFHRFDTQIMAALAAPRAVLLVNTDEDPIFPLDGINRIDEQMRELYALYGKEDHWGLFIGRGAHADTTELQEATFAWMHKWLTGEELSEIPPAKSFFSPEELQVFTESPADELNTNIDEYFIRAAPNPPLPTNRSEWETMKQNWMTELTRTTFAGWPGKRSGDHAPDPIHQENLGGFFIEAYEFTPQEGVTLRLWSLRTDESPPERVLVQVADENSWLDWLAILLAAAPARAGEIVGPGAHSVVWPQADPAALSTLRENLAKEGTALIIVATRGIGPTRFEEGARGDTIRRSFQMLGQTRDGMRVWDLRQALGVIQSLPNLNAPLHLEASGAMGGIALYASLFDAPLSSLHLRALPPTHNDGPYLMNVSRILDLPGVVAMARDRTAVILSDTDPEYWNWSSELSKILSSPE